MADNNGKLSAKTIFTKTMPFVWWKFLLGFATILISALIFGLLTGLAMLFGNSGVTLILFLIWLGLTGAVSKIINHYFGYMLKAGHIAVMQEAVTTGRIPENQIEYGKNAVKERFVTANVYFAVDKLVSGAVKQLQNTVSKVAGAFDSVPGVSSLAGLLNFFISISLGYIDECCLGYTFFKKDQGAFKSAADGVVIYAQNWKHLLKNAAKTMIVVIIAMIIITLAVFVILAGVFRIFNWSGAVAFVLAFLVATVVKSAFLDSYILAKTMTAYMEVAPSTQITFDLYGKLCNVSNKFKELFNKGKEESDYGTSAQPEQEYPTPLSSPSTLPTEAEHHTSSSDCVFCANCGTKTGGGVKFCSKCGAKLNN